MPTTIELSTSRRPSAPWMRWPPRTCSQRRQQQRSTYAFPFAIYNSERSRSSFKGFMHNGTERNGTYCSAIALCTGGLALFDGRKRDRRTEQFHVVCESCKVAREDCYDVRAHDQYHVPLGSANGRHVPTLFSFGSMYRGSLNLSCAALTKNWVERVAQ